MARTKKLPPVRLQPAAVERPDDRKRRYSAAEYREIAIHVEQAMMRGMNAETAARSIRQSTRFAQITKTFVGKIMARVQEAWAREDASLRSVNKSSQMRRIYGYIAQARGIPKIVDGRQEGWQVPPNHAALVRWENLLADIQGTRAPVEVNVNDQLRISLTAVIGRMEGDAFDRMLERARNNQLLAQRAQEAGLASDDEGRH